MAHSVPDTSDPVLTHEIPFPLAWRYEHARAQGMRMGLRYPRTLAFAENILRFLALVNVASRRHQRLPVGGKLTPQFSRPDFGKWGTYFMEDGLGAGLAATLEAFKQGELPAHFKTLREARNEFAHGGLGGGEATCAKGVEGATKPLAAIQEALRVLTHYRLGWVEEVVGGWVWAESRGQVECRRSPVQDGALPFAPRRVVLWKDREVLCLEPCFVEVGGRLAWVKSMGGDHLEYSPAGRVKTPTVVDHIPARKAGCTGCRATGNCHGFSTDSPPPEPIRPPQPPGFTLQGCLVQGAVPNGDGDVWQAMQAQDVRTLRFVPASSDRDKFGALRALGHSRMQSPKELIVVGDRAAVVAPFERGDTLARSLEDSGKLTPGDAAAQLGPVLDALDHAWRERGLRHGRLTKEDILLTAQGPKLMNFGVTPWLGRPVTDDLVQMALILEEALPAKPPKDDDTPYVTARIKRIKQRAQDGLYRTPHAFAQDVRAAIALRPVPLKGRIAAKVAEALFRHVEARWPMPIALAVQRVTIERATGGHVATCARAFEAAEVALSYAGWRDVKLKQPSRLPVRCAPEIALDTRGVAAHYSELLRLRLHPEDDKGRPLVSLAMLLRTLEWRVGTDLVLCGEPDKTGFAQLVFAGGAAGGAWVGDRLCAGRRGAWLHAGLKPVDFSPFVVLETDEPDILLVRGVVGDTVRYWSSLKGRIVSRRDLKGADALRKALG